MRVPSHPRVLEQVADDLARHGRVGLCQIVRTEGSTPGKQGWKLLVRPDGSTFGNLGGGAFEAAVTLDAGRMLGAPAARAATRRYYFTEEAVKGEPTGMICGGMSEVLIEVIQPEPLLVICGGGPVGQALAANAPLCGFEVLVADDREEFRRPELFPEGTLLAPVDREFRAGYLAPHSRRQILVAVVTRCWETDLAALAGLLEQDLPHLSYLGLMGSRRKIARVKAELEGRGVELPAVGLQAPIGLPIGGETPGELAVAILAEMIQTRRTAAAAADGAADGTAGEGEG